MREHSTTGRVYIEALVDDALVLVALEKAGTLGGNGGSPLARCAIKESVTMYSCTGQHFYTADMLVYLIQILMLDPKKRAVFESNPGTCIIRRQDDESIAYGPLRANGSPNHPVIIRQP